MKPSLCCFVLFLSITCSVLGLSSQETKRVEIEKLHQAFLEKQTKNEAKSSITDLLINNILGVCYVSCSNGGMSV